MKHKYYPSQIKYNKSHPVISCRVSEELYTKLEAIKRVTGKSFVDILKEGMGVEKRGKRFLFHLGYCCVCNEPLWWDLSKPEDQQLLIKAIHSRHMYHGGCKPSSERDSMGIKLVT